MKTRKFSRSAHAHGNITWYVYVMVILLVNIASVVGQTVPFTATEILGRPTGNSITINAVAARDIEVYAEYGTSSGIYSNSTIPFVYHADSTVQITISGLLPDIRYFYRLRFREMNSGGLFSAGNEHFFHTARPRNSTFSFAIHADPHLDTSSDTNCYRNALLQTLYDKPDFMIDLGDNFMCEKLCSTYECSAYRIRMFRSWYQRICHSVPLFLVQGNHEGEYGTLNDGTGDCMPVWVANLRKKYFFNPHPDAFYSGDTTVQPFIGSRDYYYAFQWGNALFVAIDPYWYTKKQAPNDDKQWNFTLGTVQYEWLKRTLEQSTAQYKFIFCHHLVGGKGEKGPGRGGIEWASLYEHGGQNADSSWGFESHRPGWEKPIHQLMVANKVTVFFHGHDHFYAKQELDGIIYQECPQPSLPNYTSANAATEYGYTHGDIRPNSGYLRVTVSSDSVFVEYVRAYAADNPQKGYINGKVETSYSIKPATTTQLRPIPKTASYLHLRVSVTNSHSAIVNFSLDKPQQASILLYDIRGRVVVSLDNAKFTAGIHTIRLNRDRIAPGTYFVRLHTLFAREIATCTIQ